MRYINYFIIAFCVAMMAPVAADAQVAPDKINGEKLQTSVKAVLGEDAAIEWVRQPLTPEIKKTVKANLKIKQSLPDTLYIGKVQVKKGTRYLIPDIAPSKSRTFSYVLYVGQDKEIMDVDVLTYRENYGYEIDYPYFRKQFQGKKKPKQIRFARSIQNISGATISARSLTYSVHDLMVLIQKLPLN